jgi:hypothetical protein
MQPHEQSSPFTSVKILQPDENNVDGQYKQTQRKIVQVSNFSFKGFFEMQNKGL